MKKLIALGLLALCAIAGPSAAETVTIFGGIGTPPGGGSYILLETTGYLLLETGGKICLETSSVC